MLLYYQLLAAVRLLFNGLLTQRRFFLHRPMGCEGRHLRCDALSAFNQLGQYTSSPRNNCYTELALLALQWL